MRRRIAAGVCVVLAACLVVLPQVEGQAAPAVPLAAPDWTTLLSEDLEGDFPGSTWTLEGDPTWGTTGHRAHGGSSSAYCAAGGSSAVSAPGPYGSEMGAWMTYGPFDLSHATDAQVHFFLWSKTESGYDYLALAASSDDENWDGTAWSGDFTTDCPDGWCEETFTLTDVGELGNLCGQPKVWISFGFVSDMDVQLEGSYIDDIELRAVVGGAEPTATPTGQPGSGRVYLPVVMRKM